MDFDSDFLPPWGYLPIEQYLIRHWDVAAVESLDQQRLQLIYQFLELDEFPHEWFPVDRFASLSRIPTVEEINTILRPWRSENLRRRACRTLHSDKSAPIFLRTHYNPLDDSDARIKEWVNASEEFADRAWWALLDDQNSFNFGSDWRRVYEILPEVAGPVEGNDCQRYASPELVNLAREQFKSYLTKEKKARPDQWRNRDQFIEVVAADLLRTVAAMYMLIADKEAFDTGLLRLVYLDGKRNVIREMRVETDEQTITDVIMDWYNWNLPDELWEEGTIGDRYRISGDLGKELYRLTEADLADP
ncbi:unnamed protein product [Aspergillus oryzae]|nr:unnamed protein product [Aspergillus oryzae]GMF90551.1 unnamed protein product [Aspergillus oryzae]